jgi:hypothetical protein
MSESASAWPSWGGRWGDTEGADTSPGPRSRGQHERFTAPRRATSCTDRWTGENNQYACSVRAAAARSADVDECDPWFGPAIAVGVCDPAIIRDAITKGTVGRIRPGIDAPGAANANGVAQLAGMLTVASPPVRVEAASGLVYARAVSGRQAIEALYDARPGGLVIKARRDALARPLLRVRDGRSRLVAPRATYRAPRSPAVAPGGAGSEQGREGRDAARARRVVGARHRTGCPRRRASAAHRPRSAGSQGLCRQGAGRRGRAGARRAPVGHRPTSEPATRAITFT